MHGCTGSKLTVYFSRPKPKFNFIEHLNFCSSPRQCGSPCPPSQNEFSFLVSSLVVDKNKPADFASFEFIQKTKNSSPCFRTRELGRQRPQFPQCGNHRTHAITSDAFGSLHDVICSRKRDEGEKKLNCRSSKDQFHHSFTRDVIFPSLPLRHFPAFVKRSTLR